MIDMQRVMWWMMANAQSEQEKPKRRGCGCWGCGGWPLIMAIVLMAAIWFPWEQLFK